LQSPEMPGDTARVIDCVSASRLFDGYSELRREWPAETAVPLFALDERGPTTNLEAMAEAAGGRQRRPGLCRAPNNFPTGPVEPVAACSDSCRRVSGRHGPVVLG